MTNYDFNILVSLIESLIANRERYHTDKDGEFWARCRSDTIEFARKELVDEGF